MKNETLPDKPDAVSCYGRGHPDAGGRAGVARRKDRVGMLWFVRGADARTGKDGTFEVVAPSRDEATEEARRRGIYVEFVSRVATRAAVSRRAACDGSPLSLVPLDVDPEPVAVTSEPPPTAAASHAQPTIGEVTVLESAEVTVTTTRLVVAGRTHVLAPGTFAWSATIRPDGSVVILLLLVGTMIAAAGGILQVSHGVHAAAWTAILWVISTGLVGAGLLVAAVDRPRYAIRLEGSLGEVDAAVSGNRPWVESVVSAVNQAIASRGAPANRGSLRVKRIHRNRWYNRAGARRGGKCLGWLRGFH